MSLDYSSLLLAVGFSAACLGLTLFGIWLTARSEKFLLTWAVSVLLIVCDVFVYQAYIDKPGRLLGIASFTLLLLGFSTMLGAAHQFTTGSSPLPRIAVGAGISLAVALPPWRSAMTGWASCWRIPSPPCFCSRRRYEYWKGRDRSSRPDPRHRRALLGHRHILRAVRQGSRLGWQAGAWPCAEQLGRGSQPHRRHRLHDRHRRAVAGAQPGTPGAASPPRSADRSADRPAQPARLVRPARQNAGRCLHRRDRVRSRRLQGHQ